MGSWPSTNDVKFTGDEPGVTVIKDGRKLPLGPDDRVFVSEAAQRRGPDDRVFVSEAAQRRVAEKAAEKAAERAARQAAAAAGQSAARAGTQAARGFAGPFVRALARDGEKLLVRGLAAMWGVRRPG